MRRCVVLTLVALPVLVTAAVLAGCGAESGDEPAEPAPQGGSARIVVALPERDSLGLVDPDRGLVGSVPVGPSPWGVAVAGPRAYVSTATHVAIVDLARGRLLARVRYRTPVGAPEVGEFRSGGMGIAVAPGGRRVYVGVHPEGGGDGSLEVIDVGSEQVDGMAPIGERPFDVLVARDGSETYTVDHDSYGITTVHNGDLTTRTTRVAPLGRGAFDKLNYGALDRRGRLLLPVNGEVLSTVDPRSGAQSTRAMRARVHQAGVTRVGSRLLTIGAEALESDRGPNLSVYDLRSGRERVLPLERPHEDVVASADGRFAYLSGGYTRGGWAGITVVRLADGRTRELELPAPPLGIALVGGDAAKSSEPVR